ncbi:uncharacterized protein MELLADRAFT_103262 [Melampsora larici-populina 98AG31]|uniref:Uncharacterized protein n=1 Tax=Melampsora larici-populina (strain 98AG31 / pathotype 3-4-7) TaxID=747676 RepID=F4R9U0_MELLP|nr:uncharacterized protein MELLADRAFT_103262 [Melampsora larici-populina 98AG31]EGG10675.1 hypothetical protein MELLADRAFT_103262 [Melampsora larici-populina 98AG31]
MQATTRMRLAGIGPYTKLTLKWAGPLMVQDCVSTGSALDLLGTTADLSSITPQRHNGRLRNTYDASVVLNQIDGPVNVTLVQEVTAGAEYPTGQLHLHGVVVRGQSQPSMRLVIEHEEAVGAYWADTSMGPSPGLNVLGRGMVLSDSLVSLAISGQKWRVAAVMHREWDMQAVGLDGTPGSVVAGQLLLLRGTVLSMNGSNGRWVVKVVVKNISPFGSEAPISS